MIRALYSAGSGMSAQQMNVDNIAHNLANANTTGFKMRRTEFQDLLYQTVVQPGAAAGGQTVVPSGLQLGLGARPAANEIIFQQGDFQQTNNPLDLVIQGRGFFQVRRATGELAFTRSGAFHLDRDGNLVTLNGDALDPQITVPPEAQSITVAGDGTVSYASWANRDSTRRSVAACQFRQSRWLQQYRKQPLYAYRRLRGCHHRYSQVDKKVWEPSNKVTLRVRTSASSKNSSI